MEKDFKQFIKDSRKVGLSKEEKSQGREQFLNFMRSNPVRDDLVIRPQVIWSNIFTYNITYKKPMGILITLILVLSAGGGVTLASQNSLPGDTLYPVKVKSEEVRSAFAFSTEAKAEFQARLAAERLEEAEELSSESKLDAELRAQLEERFERHANRVEEHAKVLAGVDAKAAADISANLETSLRAHDRILSRLGVVKNATIEPQIKQLLIKVRSEVNDATKNKQREEAQVKAQTNVQASAEGRLNAAENKIEEVEEFLNRVEAKLGSEATVDAEARLQVAENLVVEGKAKLEAKSYNEAFLMFGRAHQIAQEAKLLIEAKQNLDVDVRFNSESNTEASNGVNSETKADGSIEIQLGR